ncbi:hypothetical protein TNCV_5123271 [Trichonephila clavipes]|nr:hypothetical protein TNCV_5123271 [Trichonephila clavipes]
MIKFIDFCEVRILPESVARVITIEITATTRLGIDSKRLLDVSLGYSKTSSFQTLSKLIWCGIWGCNPGPSLSKSMTHVFYRRKIRRESRPDKHPQSGD